MVWHGTSWCQGGRVSQVAASTTYEGVRCKEEQYHLAQRSKLIGQRSNAALQVGMTINNRGK